jgi:Hydrolase of X-linked nucleoside diphosphate N terminal
MNILPLLDELQAIARNGLAYTTNPYDRERYEHLLCT